MTDDDRKLRILMAYEHYPCSIGRFWKRGLRRLGHHVDDVGHCTHGQISWGSYDLSRWEDVPTHELESLSNQYIIDERLRSIASEYDLFINVDAAHWWVGNVGIPKVIIGTDPHCLDYRQQRQDCDLFVCMQECYSQLGDVWIPYAYDEEWHYRAEVPDSHDITFLGVLYDVRQRDIDGLQRSGIRVVSNTGIVFSEGSPIYSAAPLAYCRPSLLDLPTRFFEAMAYGTIPILTHCPDLAMFPEFCNELHYEVFSTTPHLVDLVKYLLESPEVLQQRRAMVREAVKPHGWSNRAATLIQNCYAKGMLQV